MPHAAYLDSRVVSAAHHTPPGELAMTFDELLAQVIELLQRQGRVSYWALKRRFNLDDDATLN